MSMHRIVVLALAGVLLFAGCSNGTPTTTAAPRSADVVVTMSEWRFSPQDVVVAGTSPAIVELRNVGSVLHEWAVVDGPVTRESELSGVNVLAQLKVNTGGTAQLELPALEPGEYTVVCPIPGHIANGMVGTLTVQE